MAARRISVLGDSISTFQDYTPPSGVYYAPSFGSVTGVASAEDCWWMRVIRAIGGELLRNDSWSGSTVCSQGAMPACSPSRVKRLRGEDGRPPELVLVYTGLNDVERRIPAEVFREEYQLMLRRIKEQYPGVEVCCGTLVSGYLGDSPFRQFAYFQKRLDAYNQAIRDAAQAEDCQVADMAALGKEYASMDGLHPNGRGMEQLAALWLESLGAAEAE